MSGAAPVVDVHCHMFNAADIPVRGFVRHVVLKDRSLSAWIAGIAARLTDGAPGHAEDLARIDALFHGGGEAASPGAAEQHLQEQVAEAVGRLTETERLQISQELEGEAAQPVGGPEGLSFGAVWRFVSWAKLFSQSRVDLATLYAREFTPAAQLAVPMLVDLARGVADTASTSLDQQIDLFAKLSEASMHGLLPGAGELRLHPFVSFDPFRVVDGHAAADGRPIREVIEDALLNRGFAGVKVYPEMGWRPTGNTAANAGTADRARRLDEVLEAFFGWCADNSVPVTAHCNHSNFPHPAFEQAGYGAPAEWLLVLRRHAGLRVNLGHFGGAHADERDYAWAWDIANAMSEFPDRLFADVGCHPTYDEALMTTHFRVLRQMADAVPEVPRQLMFGTDWYMLAVNPGTPDFASTYQRLFRTEFGDEAATDFMGRNALRFLGFARSTDRNAERRTPEATVRRPRRRPTGLASAAGTGGLTHGSAVPEHGAA